MGDRAGRSGFVWPHMTCSGASVVSPTLVIVHVMSYLVLASVPIVCGNGQWWHWHQIIADLGTINIYVTDGEVGFSKKKCILNGNISIE